MRAGIRIYQGANPPNEQGGCTMAFHIVDSGDEQFLTAGHCGFGGSNNWFHPGYGAVKVGSELGTLYAANGHDAMRVQMSDAQDSNRIYLDTQLVTTSRNPIQGEGVCASLGFDGSFDCGTVVDSVDTWIGEACGCVINGADSDGITIIPGDSGSPMVNNVSVGNFAAIGIVNLADGHFARMQTVLNLMDVVIRP